jgi:hypothetical protein
LPHAHGKILWWQGAISAQQGLISGRQDAVTARVVLLLLLVLLFVSLHAGGTHLNVRPDGIEGVDGRVFHDAGQTAGHTVHPKGRSTVPRFPILIVDNVNVVMAIDANVVVRPFWLVLLLLLLLFRLEGWNGWAVNGVLWSLCHTGTREGAQQE